MEQRMKKHLPMREKTNLKRNKNPVAAFSRLDLKRTHKKRPVEAK